jgi:hypothetical protein
MAQITEEQRRVANLLGIQNIDSQNDFDRINHAIGSAKQIGINRLDSVNDLKRINEYYASQTTNPAPTTDPTPTTDPSTTTGVDTEINTTSTGTGTGTNFQDIINQLQIKFSGDLDEATTEITNLRNEARTRETGFAEQLRIMQESQVAREQEYLRKSEEQQKAFDTAQRVSASNMARGGQQADYRLGGAGVIRGGTAGFRRRPKSKMPAIGAAGFTAANANKAAAKTLNV